MKFVNTGIVFQEVPDEVSLSVNISGCPCHCPGCHSGYLWRDEGSPLNPEAIDCLMRSYGRDITCISFMGGDADPAYVCRLSDYVHKAYPDIKVAWYSGRTTVPGSVNRQSFDYIKTGPYIRHLGGLRSRTTNQRLYKRTPAGTFTDITYRFWSREA